MGGIILAGLCIAGFVWLVKFMNPGASEGEPIRLWPAIAIVISLFLGIGDPPNK